MESLFSFGPEGVVERRLLCTLLACVLDACSVLAWASMQYREIVSTPAAVLTVIALATSLALAVYAARVERKSAK